MFNEVMSLDEFLSEMEEQGLDGTSRYQLRNESIQNKQRSGISRLKREKKKNLVI